MRIFLTQTCQSFIIAFSGKIRLISNFFWKNIEMDWKWYFFYAFSLNYLNSKRSYELKKVLNRIPSISVEDVLAPRQIRFVQRFQSACSMLNRLIKPLAATGHTTTFPCNGPVTIFADEMKIDQVMLCNLIIGMLELWLFHVIRENSEGIPAKIAKLEKIILMIRTSLSCWKSKNNEKC